MNTHSKVGPSSVYRYKECPGSVKLSVGIEQVSSPYAEEGTKAHELAALILNRSPIPPNIYSEEMLADVKIYTDQVVAEANGAEILVEVKFDLSHLIPNFFGTADAVIYHKEKKLLSVWDLKFGKGVPVEAENNTQLKSYCLGSLVSTGLPCSEVELVISQPRCAHINGTTRRWRTSALNILEFAADLQDYVKATEDPKASLHAGDHCRFCPAIGICPELKNKALAVAQKEFSPTLSYNPIELSETLKKVDLLEEYAKGVRAFAYSEAEHGRCPPGWKLVQKRSTRKWLYPEEEMKDVLRKNWSLKPQEIMDPPTLKSVAQVEKLFSKDKKVELNKFITSVSSGLALVEESDPRPNALVGAELEFDKIL